jgi:hypothetical protein
VKNILYCLITIAIPLFARVKVVRDINSPVGVAGNIVKSSMGLVYKMSFRIDNSNNQIWMVSKNFS